MKCRAKGCRNDATVNLFEWPLCRGCDLVRRDLERSKPCQLHKKKSCNFCSPTLAGPRSRPAPIDTSKTCPACGEPNIVRGRCTICGAPKDDSLLGLAHEEAVEVTDPRGEGDGPIEL